MPAAVKRLRREVWECACQSAPNLAKFPRASVEFAVEPLDNFGQPPPCACPCPAVLSHAPS
eukprot:1766293-Rhodomonas_salina.3